MSRYIDLESQPGPEESDFLECSIEHPGSLSNLPRDDHEDDHEDFHSDDGGPFESFTDED